jgi:hypothetical protein
MSLYWLCYRVDGSFNGLVLLEAESEGYARHARRTGGPQPFMQSLHNDAALRRALQDRIGEELRARYDDRLRRELSVRLLYLLESLERAEVAQKTQMR